VAVQRNQWQQPRWRRSGWSPLGLIGSGFLKWQCVAFLTERNDNSAVVLLEMSGLICIGCCGHFLRKDKLINSRVCFEIEISIQVT
jgi:hypothetical protein